MTRYCLLQATVLTCLILFEVKGTLADNVLVDLTEDRTLTIVEEFVGGKTPPVTGVKIATGNGVVSLQPLAGTINGEPGILDLDPADIHTIEFTNVDLVVVSIYVQPLIADLTIHGAEIVEIEAVTTLEPVGILGNTTISNGRGTAVVAISRINLFGNLSVSTGLATDLVHFGRPYIWNDRWGPVNIYGNLSINTGQDWDELWINDDLYVGGDVEIELGQGSDLLLGEDRLTTEPDSNVSISLGQQ